MNIHHQINKGKHTITFNNYNPNNESKGEKSKLKHTLLFSHIKHKICVQVIVAGRPEVYLRKRKTD